MGLVLYWLIVIKLAVIVIFVLYIVVVFIRMHRLRMHGCRLMLQFEQTQNIADVNEAIDAFEMAVQLAHQNLQPPLLNFLGASLHRRFNLTGDLDDVSHSILVFQKALHVLPRGRPEVPVPVMLNNLAVSFVYYFQRTASLWRLDAGISAYRAAIQHMPDGQRNLVEDALPERPTKMELTSIEVVELPELLTNLGMALRMRYDYTGDSDNIDEAISLQRRAVQLTPDSHTARVIRLGILGRSLRSRFQNTFDPQDLAHAISAQRRAVELIPDGHSEIPRLLADLGWTLRIRATQAMDFDDLGEAISLHRSAVEMTPKGHKDLMFWLSQLAESLRHRFNTTGEIPDITEAITMEQRALDLVPPSGADLSKFLGNLGLSLNLRFTQTGDLHDSVESISALQRAVAISSDNQLETSKWLQILGSSLQQRFFNTGDISHIDEAISVGQRAVELTPEGHERRTDCLGDLAISLYGRSQKNGNIDDLHGCISRLEEAATGGLGAPRSRLLAAKRWARVLRHHYPESPSLMRAYEMLMSVIPVMAGLEQTINRRFSQLEAASEFGQAMQLMHARQESAPSGSAQEAAAVACQLGRVEKALEWLEEGRCLVWRQISNLRAPIDDLTSRDSELAQRFRDISRRLDVSALSCSQSCTDEPSLKKVSVEDEALAHVSLATEWNDILKTIRSLSGFEYFLQPLPCTTLMQHLPAAGPIIIVNVDERRCDAIALLRTGGEPLHIPLPLFSLEKAKKYRSDLKDGLVRTGLRVRESIASPRAMEQYDPKKPHRRDTVQGVLQSLWTEVVKPILDALEMPKLSEENLEALPRIWWCPTGFASFLPIHAAGDYSGSQPESLSDYAISSYTPTVHALTSRVESDHTIDKDSRGLFLTCQPTAIERSPIHGTTSEVASILSKAEDHGVRALKLEGDDLSIDECLKYMEEFSSVHLACHATQNAAEPLQSRFLFHKGSLPLLTILQKNLPNADLAFLSACQTSSGEERLSDEAVHLAAGMLAAGYRRVVATMWAIGDQHAQAVATDFYEYLWSRRKVDGGSGFDGSLSAEALHHAVRKLRRDIGDSEKALLAWIPFVHFGY